MDFVLEKDRELLPIEVKSSWKPGKIPSGLSTFFRYYPEAKSGIVLYDGPEMSCSQSGREVHFVPIHKASRVLEVL